MVVCSARYKRVPHFILKEVERNRDWASCAVRIQERHLVANVTCSQTQGKKSNTHVFVWSEENL